MLDLKSNHPQSVTEPDGEPEAAIGSLNPVNGLGLESSIGSANDLLASDGLASDGLADDELQTVERVLPQSHNSIAYNSTAHNSGPPPLDQLPGSPLHYLQGVHTKTGAFIRTNLPRTERARTTDNGIVWLMGRSRNCAIVFPDPAVSRCHAVMGYDSHQGFYIMDVGSSNGTFLNQQRLVAMQRYTLKNSDVITISHIKIEIFLLNQD
jgi:FHA domain